MSAVGEDDEHIRAAVDTQRAVIVFNKFKRNYLNCQNDET